MTGEGLIIITGLMDLNVSLSKINRGTVKAKMATKWAPMSPIGPILCQNFGVVLGYILAKFGAKRPHQEPQSGQKSSYCYPFDYISTAIASPVDSSKFHEP